MLLDDIVGAKKFNLHNKITKKVKIDEAHFNYLHNDIYYTTSSNTFITIIQNKFKNIPVRAYYDFNNKMYVFADAQHIIHQQLIYYMTLNTNVYKDEEKKWDRDFYTDDYGWQEDYLIDSYLEPNAALFQVIWDTDIDSHTWNDKYNEGYWAQYKNLNIICRPKELQKCEKVPLFYNLTFNSQIFDKLSNRKLNEYNFNKVNWKNDMKAIGNVPATIGHKLFAKMMAHTFLRLTPKFSYGDDDWFDKQIKDNNAFGIPFLKVEFDFDNKIMKVVGHEGRHRVAAVSRLKDGEITSIPVAILYNHDRYPNIPTPEELRTWKFEAENSDTQCDMNWITFYNKLPLTEDVDYVYNKSIQLKLNEAFWKWFGKSKIVDESGNPMVCYHGTPVDFNEFDKSKRGIHSKGPGAGVGFWFSTAPEYFNYYKNHMEVYLSIQNPKIFKSGSYSNKELQTLWDLYNNEKDNDEKYYIYKLIKGISTREDAYEHFLLDLYSSNNQIPINQNFYGDLRDIVRLKNPEQAYDNYINKLKSEGYDGIIIKNTKYDSSMTSGKANTQIVAFEPNQIKSIKNGGRWDGSSQNIYESVIKRDDGEIGGYYTHNETDLLNIINNQYPSNDIRVLYDIDRKMYIFSDTYSATHFNLMLYMILFTNIYDNIPEIKNNKYASDDVLQDIIKSKLYFSSFKIFRNYTNDSDKKFLKFLTSIPENATDNYDTGYACKINDKLWAICREDEIGEAKQVPLLQNKKWIKLNPDQLNESVGKNYLYHGTKLDVLFQILKDNMLEGSESTSGGGYCPYGVSTSRSLNFAYNFAENSMHLNGDTFEENQKIAVIVLDKDKLKQNHKIIPFRDENAFGIYDEDSTLYPELLEKEEIVMGDIRNVKNYIVGIFVSPDCKELNTPEKLFMYYYKYWTAFDDMTKEELDMFIGDNKDIINTIMNAKVYVPNRSEYNLRNNINEDVNLKKLNRIAGFYFYKTGKWELLPRTTKELDASNDYEEYLQYTHIYDPEWLDEVGAIRFHIEDINYIECSIESPYKKWIKPFIKILEKKFPEEMAGVKSYSLEWHDEPNGFKHINL